MMWKRRRKTTVHNAVPSPIHTWQSPPPIDDPQEYYKSTPSRPPSLESDVIVPLAQSLITGLLIGIAAFGIIWPVMGLRAAASVFLVVMVLVTLIVWLTIIRGYYALLSTVEEIVKETPPVKEIATVEIFTPPSDDTKYPSLHRFHLPAGIDVKSFNGFLTGITKGKRPITLDVWAGAGSPFSRSEFTSILANLTDAGYIRLKNEKHPNQGRLLTSAGKKAILEYLYQQEPT